MSQPIADNERTDYMRWRTSLKGVLDAGDPAAMLQWLCENPSPMLKRAVFSDERPTQRQVWRRAVLDTVRAFKGTRVRVEASDSPDERNRWVWDPTGVLLGTGTLAAESDRSSLDLVLLEDDTGNLLAIRADHVLGIEREAAEAR